MTHFTSLGSCARFAGLLAMLVVLAGCQTIGLHPPPTLHENPGDLSTGHLRAVWMQSVEPQWANHLLPMWHLAGYDSEDGRGQRLILDRTDSYFRPQLTGDGRRIVYSDIPAGTVHVVGFDGRRRRELCPGRALEVWRDPNTGTDYAFVQRGPRTGEQNFRENPVYRVNLDDPNDTLLAWDQTDVMYNNFQVSRDGKRVAIEAPWPRCINAHLPNASWKVFGRGCYPSLAPDNSYIAWHMDGRHRSLLMFTPSGRTWWRLAVNHVPGFDGEKIHQPHWTNHVRYLVLSGPYPDDRGGPAGNDRVTRNNIYLGRFAPDLRRIDAWARISDTPCHTMYPDAWLADGDLANAPTIREDARGSRFSASGRPWPGRRDGLVFLWDGALADNQWPHPQTGKPTSVVVTPIGRAAYGPSHGLDLTDGGFLAETDTRAIVDAIARSGQFTVEVIALPDGPRHANSGPIVIMQPDLKPGERNLGNFVIEFWRGEFHCYVRSRLGESGKPSGNWDRMGDGRFDRPSHLLLTVSDHRVVGYANGVCGVTDVDIRPDLSLWKDMPLRFGLGSNDPNWNYDGKLLAVAIYDRFMQPDEVQHRYQLARRKLADWSPPRKAVVRATLSAIAPVPDPAEIAPYRRALVQSVYEVDRVLEGSCPTGTILVHHWAIMDSAVLPSIRERAVGETYEMTIERYEDNPQLESERTIVCDQARLDLPAWYCPSRRPIDRRTPAEKLRDAIAQEETEIVRELLDEHPDLVRTELPLPKMDVTVLPMELVAGKAERWNFDACREMASLLIERGATMDLASAARLAHVEVLQQALQQDPNALAGTDRMGRVLLHSAALIAWPHDRQERMVQFLLDHGAAHDAFTAAYLGQEDILAGFLAEDPNTARAVDIRGTSILHWACRAGREHPGSVACTRRLLQAGADPDAADPAWGEHRPLHYVAMVPGRTEQADLLARHGADLNPVSTWRPWTPLDFARNWRHKEMAEHLESLGARTHDELNEKPGDPQE